LDELFTTGEEMNLLPKRIEKITVPPIKCQGIKTKLIPFISGNIQWDGKGKWLEPFLGSGVVVFNIQPERACLSDANPHLIRFYQDLQSGKITPEIVREYLGEQGNLLSLRGKDHYLETRARFNTAPDSLAFLFLNRSGFNGLIRFNGKGEWNVPFNHKPERYAKAYITKIANQVQAASAIMSYRDWTFRVLDWKQGLSCVEADDFVYIDPPYWGRNTDYYNGWTEENARQLAQRANELPCGFALSMWKENRFRTNSHLQECWPNTVIRTCSHFYHVGAQESNRNEIVEALAIKPGFTAVATIADGKPDSLIAVSNISMSQ
jgi:DNA adenine methylase